MEGAAQPTRIAGPRPRHGGTIERARDRVLDGVRGHFYYRVTIVSQNLMFPGLFWRSRRDLNPTGASRDHQPVRYEAPRTATSMTVWPGCSARISISRVGASRGIRRPLQHLTAGSWARRPGVAADGPPRFPDRRGRPGPAHQAAGGRRAWAFGADRRLPACRQRSPRQPAHNDRSPDY